MSLNSSTSNSSIFQLKVCPFSLLVFISSAIYITRQKQKELTKLTAATTASSSTTNSTNNNNNNNNNDNVTFYVVFVLGAPGVGKGTQCQLISERCTNHQWIHLSAGDLLRAERKKENSTLAMEINRYIDLGQLVPSNITCQLLINAMIDAYNMSTTSTSGNQPITHFLIDGFPRSKSNLDVWNSMTSTSSSSSSSKFHYQIQFVLNYVCPEEVLIGRLLERGKLTQRSDDTIDTIRTRFRTFVTETKPIIEYYETNYTTTTTGTTNTATTSITNPSKSSNIPIYTIPTDQSVEAVYQQTIQYFV